MSEIWTLRHCGASAHAMPDTGQRFRRMTWLFHPIIRDLRIGRHRQIFLRVPLPELRDVLELSDRLVDELPVHLLDLEHINIVDRAVVIVEPERSARSVKTNLL